MHMVPLMRLWKTVILPTLLYACPMIWGVRCSEGHREQLQRVATSFIIRILQLPRATPLKIVLAELGIFPVEIYALITTLHFVRRLRDMDAERITNQAYQVAIQQHYATSWHPQLKNWLARWGLTGKIPAEWTDQEIEEAYLHRTWQQGPLTENDTVYKDKIRQGRITPPHYSRLPYLESLLP